MSIIFCDIDGTLKYRKGYNTELVEAMKEILASKKHIVIFWSSIGIEYAYSEAEKLFGLHGWSAMSKQEIDLRGPIFIEDFPRTVMPYITKVQTPVFFWPKQVKELKEKLEQNELS